MDINGIKSSYRKIIENEQIKQNALKKKIFHTGTLRLFIVMACLFLLYALWGNTIVVVVVLLASVVVFANLMLYHNKLYKQKLYSEIQLRHAEEELNGLDYNFSAFDGAPEKIDSEHSFSFDLDLFGNRSFFQSINRTVTSFGKEWLVKALLHPLTGKKEILQRQEAVKELAIKPELTAHFRATGRMADTTGFVLKDFVKLASQAPSFSNSTFWQLMCYIVPLSYILLGVLCAFEIVAGSSFLYLFLFWLVVSMLPMKKCLRIFHVLDKQTATLDAYSQLFGIIENEPADSKLLKQHRSNVAEGTHKVSQAISNLKSALNNLELSAQFPIIVIFNPFLLWNVRYAIQIEKWLQKHQSDIGRWFDVLAEYDALISMSIFAYNHPGYAFPEVADSFIFDGKQLGHPLIHRDSCVCNDIAMLSKPYFWVVTGANMAGKSTYLRTIGLNHVLACTGMPVCADSLVFYPCLLVTNLRTADSLVDNESYFFAELKRLKMIIDRLQSGEELFIILDEILKGTNSEDKRKGSLALMRQLIHLNGAGIIATHDLELGKLEQEFPQQVKDYCFEADIRESHLTFSYRLREGIAQNMNACFLMKQMGITVE